VAVYTYRFHDFGTDVELARFSLSDVAHGRSVNEHSEFSGHLFLNDEAVEKDWRTVTDPARRPVVYVDRDGVLVWGGNVYKRRPLDGGTKAEIRAYSFEYYLGRRHLKTNKTYSGTDQLAVVRDLVTTMQALGGGNVALAVSQNVSGVVRGATTYFGYERYKFGDLITKMAELEDGFEYTVEVNYGPTGHPVKTLVLGYPQLGSQAAQLVLEYPGNISEHPDWPEDSSTSANSLTAIGAGEGTTMLMREGVAQAATDELAANVVLFEDSVVYKDVTTLSTLQAHANADLAWKTGASVVPKVTLRADRHPVFGTYALGDLVRLRVTSPYHPAKADGSPSLDTHARILGWDVRPQSGTELETVTLTLGEI
jgi:hypothetical protein